MLARYATASGSLEKVQNRRVAMKVTGILPEAIPVVSEAMRPNLLRKDVTKARCRSPATDGMKPWRVDPFAARRQGDGRCRPRSWPDFLEETDFDGPLIGVAATNVVLEYAWTGGPGAWHRHPGACRERRWPNG
ncbi:MAG: hypothetical protein IPP98_09690 [Gemmatimonadetes bacterium]|nr:hypothetical protein [Gemmatimonadota bacterium]